MFLFERAVFLKSNIFKLRGTKVWLCDIEGSRMNGKIYRIKTPRQMSFFSWLLSESSLSHRPASLQIWECLYSSRGRLFLRFSSKVTFLAISFANKYVPTLVIGFTFTPFRKDATRNFFFRRYVTKLRKGNLHWNFQKLLPSWNKH